MLFSFNPSLPLGPVLIPTHPGNWVSGILISHPSNNFRNAFHGRESSLRKFSLNINREVMPLRWGLVQGLVSNAK